MSQPWDMGLYLSCLLYVKNGYHKKWDPHKNDITKIKYIWL